MVRCSVEEDDKLNLFWVSSNEQKTGGAWQYARKTARLWRTGNEQEGSSKGREKKGMMKHATIKGPVR